MEKINRDKSEEIRGTMPKPRKTWNQDGEEIYLSPLFHYFNLIYLDLAKSQDCKPERNM